MKAKPAARRPAKQTVVKGRSTEPRASTKDGRAGEEALIEELLAGLTALSDGDFTLRMRARRSGTAGQVAARFNAVAEAMDRQSREIDRVVRVVGREGRMTERIALAGATGAWAARVNAINELIDDLVRPTTEVARVIEAVAHGDLSQKMALKIEGQPVKGEFLRIGTAVNSMVDQLSSFGAEVSRVAKEVGTDGKLGGQARVRGLSGTWKDLTDNVNSMASNLTNQV